MEIGISLSLTALRPGGGESLPDRRLITSDSKNFLTVDGEYFLVAAEA